MINQIVTKLVKREFARALKFDEGRFPELPSCNDEKPRLLYLHINVAENILDCSGRIAVASIFGPFHSDINMTWCSNMTQ